MSAQKQVAAGLALFTLLIVAFLTYSPGLSGGFLFDDYPTLKVIADVGGVHNLDSFLRFVLTGETGPLGRPLSLLTFLLNTTDWPADPEPFIYTNILIHLLNACLICWLAFHLGKILSLTPNALLASTLAATAIWVLHPINVAGVLFIVQRMTELMTTFTLVGLIAYLHGRQLLQQQLVRGYVWMSLAIVLCGVLASFSKENGILLPLYVLVMEYYIVRPMLTEHPKHWKVWSAIFLYAPLLLLVGHTVLHWHGHVATYEHRDFNLPERLMSECRAISDYMRLIVLPNMPGLSVFNDDFTVSKSLLTPVTTLPSVLFIVSLLLFVITCGRRYPMLGFAIAWFFAGHVLESTVIPLEIYFLHRNYLPMFGIVYAATYYISTTPRLYARAAITGMLLFIALEVFLTFQTAKLWGNRRDQAAVWAEEHPASVRAQQLAARYWTGQGELLRARQHFHQVLRYHPHYQGIALQIVQNKCLAGDYKPTDLKPIVDKLPHAAVDNIMLDTLDQLIDSIEDNSCKGLKTEHLFSIASSIMTNQNYQNRNALAHIYYSLARLSYLDHDLNGAIQNLDRSFEYVQNIDIAMNAAYWLGTAGLYAQAQERIALARQADQRRPPLLRGIRKMDIDYWDQYIQNLATSADKSNNQH